MATWGLQLLLLAFISRFNYSAAQRNIVLYTYTSDLNTPVCYAPVDAVILMSDFNGLKTTDPAYTIFYTNILNSFELRQRGIVRLAIILTSSVFPNQQEVGYTLQLSGTSNVTATPVLNNAQVTPLPDLLKKIKTEVLSLSGPSVKMVLFFTDEVSQIDIDGTMRETRQMRDNGYIIAGITNTNSRRVLGVLGQMTGDPNHVFVYDSALQMAQNVGTFLNTLCNGGTVQQTQPNAVFTSPTTVAVQPAQPTTNAVQPQPLPTTNPPTLAPAETSGPAATPTTFPPASSTSILVNPHFGPDSGGTVVTLTGQALLQVISISISSLPCLIVRQFGATLECRTSNTAGSAVPSNQPLQIVMTTASGSSISIPNAFTYESDPIIENFYPLGTIVSGGVVITVSGANLDSVVNADLVINVKRNGITQISFTEKCRSSSARRILCPTPTLNLPEVTSRNLFKRSLDSRIKRQAIPGMLNGGSLDFTVGITLDGSPLYSDFKGFDVYIDPYIYQFDKSPYPHKSSKSLDIKGANLTLALQEEDYTVSIGDAKCEIQRLTSDRLTCKPSKRPSSATLAEDGTYPVQVSVGTGNLRFDVGGLLYDSSLWVYAWPAVAAGLGGAGILFAIIVIISISCCRKK